MTEISQPVTKPGAVLPRRPAVGDDETARVLNQERAAAQRSLLQEQQEQRERLAREHRAQQARLARAAAQERARFSKD